MNICTDRIQQAWSDLLPAAIAHQTRSVSQESSPPSQKEMHCVADASSGRLAEFATSRSSLRQLVRQLEPDSAESFEVLRDAHGAPVWPSGWTGSITHCKGICTVAVARSHQLAGIGIDLERLGRLSIREPGRIVSESEFDLIKQWCQLKGHSADHAMTLCFSLKEAFFKFQFPFTKRWLGFLDVKMLNDGNELSIQDQSVGHAHYPRPKIGLELAEGHVLSAVHA